MSSKSFPKEERITSRKSIEFLLKKGRKEQFDFINVKTVLHKAERFPAIKVLFAVPKKRFSKAVDRNLIKRRMREAYRLNKTALISRCESNNISYDVVFIYNSDSIKTFAEIEHKLVLFLDGLMAINEINS